MAKSDRTDIVLSVLGVLGVAAVTGASVYAGVQSVELLRAERRRLLRQLDHLEGKRIRNLTTRDMLSMRQLRNRIDEIEDVLY